MERELYPEPEGAAAGESVGEGTPVGRGGGGEAG